MKDLFSLKEKVALVTGGGKGIGQSIAKALAHHGAHVVVCGRNRDALQNTVADIQAAGGLASYAVMDVVDENQVLEMREQMLKAHGGIDILVNNAGIDPHYAIMEKTTFEDWSAILDVNLNGVFLCAKHLGELMVKRGGGSMINISSIAGHIGLKRQVPYCATKGGVEQLTKSLAFDWAEHHIRVNAIAFGFIDTDLISAMVTHPHIAPRLLARIPMGRFGKIDEVCGAAVFLASGASSYVTGHSLLVDGGWTAT